VPQSEPMVTWALAESMCGKFQDMGSHARRRDRDSLDPRGRWKALAVVCNRHDLALVSIDVPITSTIPCFDARSHVLARAVEVNRCFAGEGKSEIEEVHMGVVDSGLDESL